MKWFWIALLCFGVAYAAPPAAPSAGVIERELEKDYETKPLEPDKTIPEIQIDIPSERLEMPEEKVVSICDVTIEGNDSISRKDLLRCCEMYLNRECSLHDIYDLCHRVEQCYADKGYFLARAYPPPQEISNGVLTIRVMEGTLGNLRIEGNHAYSEAFIRRYFHSMENRPLNYGKFQRALLLLNENSDLVAGAIFEKGKEVGTADLIIRVHDKRPIHLYLNENNYGRKLTTKARFGGRLDWGNVLGYGDTLSIAEVVGFPVNALYFTDIKYKVPINANGTFVEMAYLYSKFKIEEFTSLHLKGRSDIGTLKVTHAALRDRSLSVDCFGSFDYKAIQNYTLGNLSSYDKIREVTLGTLVDHYNPKQGRDYFMARFAFGIPRFIGGLKSVDSSGSRPGGGGRFIKLNVDYDRLQHVKKEAFLYLHASGQWCPYKLTLPEQIYIGGSDTVRGFPLASALGDSGYYCNVEARIPPPFIADQRFFVAKKKWKEIVQVVGFLDQGGTFFNDGPNTFLWGAGFGVRFKGPMSLSLSLDVGFPLNHKDLSTGAFTYIKITGQPF
jgi:hemolysin activation/secretion protein